MNKKGFTLAELLCVIVILGVVSIVATSGIIEMSKKTKENLYCAKIELIKEQAKEYGKKHEGKLKNSKELYESSPSLKITVEDLLNANLLDADKNNTLINPIDDTSMNHQELIIYFKNNQVNVYINHNIVCEI